MFGLQPLHIAVIVILAMLVFGPARIPELARSLGRAIVEFKQAAASIEEGVKKGVEEKPAAGSGSASNSSSSSS